MNEQTKLKLNILKDKKVVSETTVEKVFLVEEYLKEEVQNIEDLDTDFMYTHLAMAINRTEKNEQLTEENEIIKEQLVSSEFYNEASTILDNASKRINTEFNQPERTMILLHFCTLVSQRGE